MISVFDQPPFSRAGLKHREGLKILEHFLQNFNEIITIIDYMAWFC
ncbi:hypothetical protein PITCH_A1740003 [uncultured Desulfobacterium sp.]|uniref:Uncharacterized protein n=1 Tax=uncultured Desulfobacterium sp. TaxID=201089 RepID=A0A445MUK6_9BACT|nr:hypothetical protein PITCH_A1740003 [uncultured Desulfobacterium sp.]